MSELVTLPMKMTSNRDAKFVAPLLLIATILGPLLMFYAFNEDPDMPPPFNFIIPVGWFILAAPLNLFLATRMRPRNVLIDPPSIGITPIPILGIKTSAAETRSVADFKSLDYVKEAGRNGPIYRLYLRSVAAKKDIRLDFPHGVDKHQFVAQLGAALKLKVNDNA